MSKKLMNVKKWNMRLSYANFKIPTVDFAIERVKLRVALGGHNIPESVIRTRFGRSWGNLNLVYKSLADSWIVFDTSGHIPVVLDEKENE